MLGKLAALPFVMIAAGLLLGLTGVDALQTLGTVLLVGGASVLGIALLFLAVAFVQGLVFRPGDRWHRFN